MSRAAADPFREEMSMLKGCDSLFVEGWLVRPGTRLRRAVSQRGSPPGHNCMRPSAYPFSWADVM